MATRPIHLALASLLALATWGDAAFAAAQVQRNEAPYKATVGLGLLGAELGFVIPAACGLDDTWALITFPAVGAAGGAVGGYYLDTRVRSPGLSVATLAVALAFAVPSVVITVGATRYSEDDLEDDLEAATLRRLAGPGLFRGHGRALRLSVPALDVRYVVSAGPVARPGFELELPLVSGSF